MRYFAGVECDADDETEQAKQFGIVAERSAASRFGSATAWTKGADGKLKLFDTMAEATAAARELNRKCVSSNVGYRAAEYP